MESLWPKREEILNSKLNPISILKEQSLCLEELSGNIETNIETNDSNRNCIFRIKDVNSFFEVSIATFNLINGNCFPITAYSILKNGEKHTINSASEFTCYLKRTFHSELCKHILKYLICSNELYNITS